MDLRERGEERESVPSDCVEEEPAMARQRRSWKKDDGNGGGVDPVKETAMELPVADCASL